MSRLISQTFARLLACGALTLSALGASAAPVSYIFEGHFTGQTNSDPALIQALGPLLGAGQSIRQTVTFDTATTPDGLVGINMTLYRAMVTNQVQFAGFDDAVGTRFGGCPSLSDHICTVHVRDGVGMASGSFFVPDKLSIFPSTLSSTALQAASGESRPLELQFMLFFSDITGQALTSDGVDQDLASLSVSGWRGSLGVYTRGANGIEFANFFYSIDSVSLAGATGTAVPEPACLPLAVLALTVALALGRRARTTGKR